MRAPEGGGNAFCVQATLSEQPGDCSPQRGTVQFLAVVFKPVYRSASEHSYQRPFEVPLGESLQPGTVLVRQFTAAEEEAETNNK